MSDRGGGYFKMQMSEVCCSCADRACSHECGIHSKADEGTSAHVVTEARFLKLRHGLFRSRFDINSIREML